MIARIMALARRLDGVISRRHHIGITKLDTSNAGCGPFQLKQRIDPEGRFNGYLKAAARDARQT